MKKIFFLVITILVYGCSVEENLDTANSQLSETAVTVQKTFSTSNTAQQNHAYALSWNSYIIGEMMRDDNNFRSQVLLSIDPIKRTVLFSSLIDLTTANVRSNAYRYYAQNSIFEYVDCNPDQSTKWPPPLPKPPTGLGSKNSNTPMILSPYLVDDATLLIDEMNTHQVELFIPNNYLGGDFYTIGHPLTNATHGYGTQVYAQTRIYNNFACPRYIHAVPNIPVTSTHVRNNHFVLVSRPTVASAINYPYINFDLTNFLKKQEIIGL